MGYFHPTFLLIKGTIMSFSEVKYCKNNRNTSIKHNSYYGLFMLFLSVVFLFNYSGVLPAIMHSHTIETLLPFGLSCVIIYNLVCTYIMIQSKWKGSNRYYEVFVLAISKVLIKDLQAYDKKSTIRRRGVSASKEDVHNAIKNSSKGLFPKAFCKIVPDYLGMTPVLQYYARWWCGH